MTEATATPPAAPAAPAAAAPAPAATSVTPPVPAAAPAVAPATPAAPPSAASAPAAGAAAAPVEYKLALPAETLLDAEDVREVTELATKHKIAPEAAQAILERDHAVLKQFTAAQQANWEAQAAAHETALAADTEYGGANLAATKAAAQRALQKFDVNGELTNAAKLGKLESFPPLVKLLARIGKMIGEDTIVHPTGAPPVAPPATLAEALARP